MSRFKRVLIVLGSVITVLVLAVGGLFAWLWTGADVSTVGKASFDNALAIPPLAESSVDKDGTRVFDLRMRAGETEFEAGRKTPPGASTALISARRSVRRAVRRSACA